MNSAFRKVVRFINRHSILEGTTGVLVAVSGGADSVALLDILLDISRRTKAALDDCSIPKIHVAHLDHMLRAGESAEDAEFVRRLAQGLALPVTIRSADVRAAASHSRRGIEETAREIRYNYLVEVAQETGCDRIAVGHTMTDQAETFLMRLVRGAGLRGLAAMRPVSAVPTRQMGEGGTGREGERGRRGDGEGATERGGDGEGATERGDDGEGATERRGDRESGRGGKGETARVGEIETGNRVAPSPPRPVSHSSSSSPRRPVSPSSFLPLLIRPLLCITRQEVEAYCCERELQFRTDKTNMSLHYTRNRIRTGVIPALEAMNPRVVESISRAAENIAGDQDALDKLVHTSLRSARLALNTSLDGSEESTIAYSISALLAQPLEIRRRMIIESIRDVRNAANRGLTQQDCEVISAHVAAVEALLGEGVSGKHVVLPCSLEVWREFDALVIRSAGRAQTAYSLVISSGFDVEAGGFAFTLARGLPSNVLASFIAQVRQVQEATGRNWMAAALDDQVLPDRMIIRSRLPGERARITGHRRTIKLKNLMIDHKIPSSRRTTWPVVATPDGAYIWSPGLPPAVEFAAHAETKALATLRATAI